MEIGADVWIRDNSGNEAWLPGIVVVKNFVGNHVVVTAQSEYGEEFSFKIDDEANDIPDLKLRNDDADTTVENLINLTHLHEPAMLFCLQERYFKSRIYTYTGPILIAVNPFKRVDHLYARSILDDYYNFGLLRAQGIEVGTPLSPHVYAIADAAYRDMMKVVLHGYGSEKERNRNSGQQVAANQSILISGESGAGKTESTKIVLKYLTTVGNNSNSLEDTSVMEKILQSNPILEAFGNARTLRNDNSSRFGKFIELNFSKRGSLIGGSIKTYLLEKVRLPFQQVGERNFHIFYQLFAGATDEDKTRWFLSSPIDYNYTSRGGIFQLQHVNDSHEYSELRKALDTLNFCAEMQLCLFDIVVGILNLGEVKFNSFQDGEGEGSEIDFDNSRSRESMALCCGLLKIQPEELKATLCSRNITVSGENFVKKLTSVQASDARDALAKVIYAKLFDWIVKTINLSIRVDQSNVRANIGVLDIFGFESFANNSFEQLCINYTNEALQQQFNQYIFKMEQQEYHREKIEWSFIEFPDNKDCLELIEHKLNGILAMIDDECRLPKAADEKLAGRMYKAFGSNPRFSATVPQKRDFKFCINHYAGLVEYSTITFVEKNKDELPKEAATLLQSSRNSLLALMFSSPEMNHLRSEKATSISKTVKSNKSSPGAAPSSVGFQFKEQLSDLMDSIYATSPHYIRCLKPNDLNEPDNFNRPRVTEQLRYGGVLEAVRVARSGFPVRLVHHEFFVRYRLILPVVMMKTPFLPSFLKEGTDAKMCKDICEQFVVELRHFTNVTSKEIKSPRQPFQNYLKFCSSHGLSKESIQVGLSKVFLRKSSYDILESIRFKRCSIAATIVQSTFRGYGQKMLFRCILAAVCVVQRVSRGMIGRKVARNRRCLYGAIKVQSIWRRYWCVKQYKIFIFAIVHLQSCYRRNRLRRLFLSSRQTRKSLLIQTFWRMHKFHRRFSLIRSMIIWVQCRCRMKIARAVLKKLKVEARDLGKLKQSNDVLKQEIELLKQKATEERERIRKELEQQHQVLEVKHKDEEINALRQKLEEYILILESEKRSKESLEHKWRVLKESSDQPCYNCEKLRSHIKIQEETIEKQRLSLLSLKAIDREPKESLSTKSILEEEVSRLRKVSIEQKVLIDRLQIQLEKSLVSRNSKTATAPTDIVVSNRRTTDKMTDKTTGDSMIDWSSSWDNEDDSSEGGSQTDNSSMLSETVKSFEKSIDHWKNDLRLGFRVHLWEYPKFVNIEANVKLDVTGKIIQFVVINNRRGFSLFQGKYEISSLNLIDIEDCIAGTEKTEEGVPDSAVLTISAKTASMSRTIVLRLNTKEERNTILSKLRAVVAADKMTGEEKHKKSVSSKKKVAFEETSRSKDFATDHHLISPPTQRATRRLSVRETILEENLGNSGGKFVDAENKKSDHSYNVKELLQQLRDEKEQSEKLKMQLLRVNNELVEKDELIAKFKGQEVLYEQKLVEKDNIYKQDAMVRLQMGKRLEQVLMDKEDALEQLELLKMQLESIKSSVK